MEIELTFEWDNIKNKKNLKKHGISFEDAINVFFDPLRAEIYDFKNSKTEERWKVFGRVSWNLLAVSFTERNGCIRIISARQAETKEEEDYYNGIGTAESFRP